MSCRSCRVLRLFAFISLGTPVLALPFQSASAQARGEYQRPSVTIVGVNLPANLDAALSAYCGVRCENSSLADRMFVNTLGQHSYRYSGGIALVDAARRTWTPGGTAALQDWLGSSGITRATVLRLFGTRQKDYSWTIDTLVARRSYAVTAQRAQLVTRSELGMTPDLMARVLPTYFFVFTTTTPERTGTTPETVTNRRTGVRTTSVTSVTESATVIAAVYRFDYADGGVARTALDPFGCFGICPDRAARQQAFGSYLPPIREVLRFKESVSGSGPDEFSARVFLMDAIMEAIVKKSATKDATFKVRAPVTHTSPVAARIGRKEGVRSGGRFVVVERDERRGRDARIGVVLASRVADNRGSAIETSTGAALVARMDTTTFMQIHGGRIRAGQSLIEKPYFGSFSFGYVSFPANSSNATRIGLTGQLEYRAPGAPALYTAVTGSAYDPYNCPPSNTCSIYRIGIALGAEAFPARGNIRLRLQVEGGFNGFDISGQGSANAPRDSTKWYGAGTAMLAIVPTAAVSIYGGAAYYFDKSLAKRHPTGLGFTVGVRVEP